MPRQGEGHIAHNAIDADVPNVAHGAGDAKPNEVAGTKKAAPLPEHDNGGLAVEGGPASGGSSQGLPKKDGQGFKQ